jgi:DNA-binding NarL/FixJ family response regulator
MTKIKLAIAEDCEAYRKTIKKFIHLENDLEVILEAENGLHLLEQLKTTTPDIILMDIRMPEMGGVEATDRIKELYPDLKIIALSQYDFEKNIIEMNIHGVKSFIGKDDDLEELFKAIRTVNGGGVYMTDRSASIIQRSLTAILGTSEENIPAQNFPDNLSEIEITVHKYICKGLSSTDISKIIHKSHRTVEKYRNDLYQKLRVNNKKELIEKGLNLFNFKKNES